MKVCTLPEIFFCQSFAGFLRVAGFFASLTWFSSSPSWNIGFCQSSAGHFEVPEYFKLLSNFESIYIFSGIWKEACNLKCKQTKFWNCKKQFFPIVHKLSTFNRTLLYLSSVKWIIFKVVWKIFFFLSILEFKTWLNLPAIFFWLVWFSKISPIVFT